MNTARDDYPPHRMLTNPWLCRFHVNIHLTSSVFISRFGCWGQEDRENPGVGAWAVKSVKVQ